MIERRIRELVESGQLVEVYSSSDGDTFSVGWLKSMDQGCYVLLTLDEYGRHDGVRVALVEDVWQLRTETTYLQEFSHIIPKGFSSPVDIPSGSLDEILANLQETSEIVELWDRSDKKSFGRILEFDEEGILFQELTQRGVDDGFTTLARSAFRLVDIRGPNQSWLQNQFERNTR